MHILCVCLSATIQRTLSFDSFSLNEVNRTSVWREDASGKAVNSQRVIQELIEEGGKKWTGERPQDGSETHLGGHPEESACGLPAACTGPRSHDKVFSLCPLGKENARHFLKLAKRDGLTVIPFFIPGSTRICITAADRKKHTTTEIIADEPGCQKVWQSPGKGLVTEGLTPAEEKTHGKGAPQNESSLTQKMEEKFLKKYRKYLKKTDAVLIAGSKGPFSEKIYSSLCLEAEKASVPVCADFCGPALRNALEHAPVHIIKINQEEFLKTFCKEKDPKDLLECIREVSLRYNSLVIVTRGADATLAATPQGHTFEHPALPLAKEELVNTTACGDSFSAGFLYEYLSSRSIESALKKATECAALNARSLIPGTRKNSF